MKPDLDAFARLLDGDLPEGEATAEARALSTFAKALEASAARPEMANKADLRAMLIEAAREQAAAPTLLARIRGAFSDSTARIRYSARMAAATGATAMALSGSGVALAAHRSTPSQPFYAVKLAIEDLKLAFIGDSVARGEQLLAYAEQRLAEARQAAEAGDMAGARRALEEADDSGRAGAGYIIQASQDRADPSLLDILDDFARTQRRELAALLPLLSGEAVAAGEDAMVGLRRIGQRVAVLTGSCAECDADLAGSGKGGKRTSGDVRAASDPDFDFADIPHASEPFAACPCVTDDGGKTTVDGEKRKARKKATNTTQDPTAVGGTRPPADPGGGTGGDPGDDPGTGDDPEPEPDPIDKTVDETVDELPDPIKEPVKDTKDVIDDILKNPPTELPDLPGLP